MKLKLVVVDLELTRNQKRLGVGALAVAGALAASVALAEVTPFAAGETLTAAKLNANFADLDGRVTTQAGDIAEGAADVVALDTRVTDTEADLLDAETRLTGLEAAPTYLVATSSVAQSGTLGTDIVYASMEVTLQPGTWLVESGGTLFTTGAADAVQLGLWNQTASADVPNSKGSVGTSVALNGGNLCGASSCLGVSLWARAVMTVTVPTVVRARAFRNGASTLTMGSAGLALTQQNRISALKLR